MKYEITKAIASEHNFMLPKCKIKGNVISVTKFPYADEEGRTFRGKICESNYGKGQDVSLKVKDVCNWILHSYVWDITGYADQEGYAGFLLASDFDKDKFVHFVSFDEWQKVLTIAIEDGVF